jgi:putative tryptophan/tyrosine transport system substrate-binding protein
VHLIGMLMNLAKDDPESLIRRAMFVNGLAALGWKENLDFKIEPRYGEGSEEKYANCAKELVDLHAEVVLVSCGPTWRAIEQESGGAMKTVVAGIIDPAPSAAAAPAPGITTGICSYNADLAKTWLKLLMKIEPDVTSVGVVYNPFTFIGPGMLEAIKTSLPAGTELVEIDVRNAAKTPPTQFENSIRDLAAKPHSGLIVVAGAQSVIHRRVIIDIVNRFKLRAVYSNRMFVDSGGLMSYGTPTRELYQDAADLVQRILTNREVPAVRYSNKFELIINFELAEELNLGISPMKPFLNF